MINASLSKAELLAIGRAVYSDRTAQGSTTDAAVDGALEAVIMAERAVCRALAESWIDTGGRYGFKGDQVAKRIAEDIGDRA